LLGNTLYERCGEPDRSKDNTVKGILLISISLILIEANTSRAAQTGSSPFNSVRYEQDAVLGGFCAAGLYNTEPFEYVTTTLTEGIYSFDVISNAQSVALGESFVANPDALAAFKNNPAALIGIEGLNLYYNRRPMDWNSSLEGAHYYSLGLLFDGSIGKFGIDYSRYSMDVTNGRTIYMPEGYSRLIELYNHTITVASAIHLYRGIIAGVNLKYFNFGENYEDEEPEPKQERNGAFVCDIGVLYEVRGFADEQSVKDRFRFGLSFQNYGTDYETGYTGQEEFSSVELPRYFRFGFSYKLTNYLRPDREFFGLMITGEYRKFLNPGKYDEGETDYGGIGFDFSFFEVISCRIGGIIQPDRNIYGYNDRLMMRYGFGINLPFERLNYKYPLTLSFEYANIPLYEPDIYFGLDRDSFSVYTVVLKYEDAVF